MRFEVVEFVVVNISVVLRFGCGVISESGSSGGISRGGV